MSRRVLVTGGAGFVGANLTMTLAERQPGWEILALDNLKRRGSELNLPRLRDAGVDFVHGDVRDLADVLALDPVDAIVECSAEPSALAGSSGDTSYVIDANLMGARNCLELARRDSAQFVFISTSRVYPFDALDAAAFREADTRFELSADQDLPGIGPAGVSEGFPLAGPRTLYGATKLAGELLVTEYRAAFGIPTVIDRCGVLAGPWQMGKVDQGVFTHWVLSHYFGRGLSYMGYGGTGKQVRDLLHIADLVDLVEDQLLRPDHWDGVTANVGGGPEVSLSLLETTAICEDLTGHQLEIGRSAETRPGDVRIYVSDCARLCGHTDWRPSRTPRQVLSDIFDWVHDHEHAVRAAIG